MGHAEFIAPQESLNEIVSRPLFQRKAVVMHIDQHIRIDQCCHFLSRSA
jgi:hypothetical protein